MCARSHLQRETLMQLAKYTFCMLLDIYMTNDKNGLKYFLSVCILPFVTTSKFMSTFITHLFPKNDN